MTRRRRRPARRLNRQQVIHAVMVTGAMALVAFAVGVWTLLVVVVDGNRKIDALYQSATENRAKLVSVGEVPVGPPPEQIVGKTGPPGQAGTPGAPGAQGPAGRDGRDGKDATPAQVAAAVAAYMRAHPVKPGPAGRDGRDGLDGQSPACLAEVDECRGATGAKGDKGDPGQPAAAWLWTDPATKVSFECRRNPDSPDNAPAYACAPVG